MADAKNFQLEIITPERTFFEGEATFLEIATSEGILGIYAGHVPLTAVLVPGVCRIVNESVERKAAIHSGFMEILKDRIVVLAEIAEWPDEIDINRAKEAKIRAERRLAEGDGH